jgi:hypothetical protein
MIDASGPVVRACAGAYIVVHDPAEPSWFQAFNLLAACPQS